MTLDLARVRIFVRPGITDMRKQINGLAAIVQEGMGCDPLDGSLYLFLGKTKRVLKAVYWDRNGFCLWQKRLERDRFPWPGTGEATREVDREELAMLLSGIDFWNAHRALTFTKAG